MFAAVVAAPLLIAMTACGSTWSRDGPRKTEVLPSRSWALRELDGLRVPESRPEVATIELASDRTVRGSSACNRVGGEEILGAGDPRDRQGTFRSDVYGATITTTMGCADRAGMVLGGRFWERMVHATAWSIEGRSLTIRFDDGTSARLEPTSPPRR